MNKSKTGSTAKGGYGKTNNGRRDEKATPAPMPEMSNAERRFRKSVKYKKLQRQKMIKRVSIISVSAIIAIIAGAIIFNIVHDSIYGYIMTFDGSKISTEEFKLLYLLGTDGEKQEALDMLTEYLVIEKTAGERGFSLTEEEKDDARENISSYKEYIKSLGANMPKVSDDRLVELIGIGTLYGKLEEEISNDFVVDEQDFSAALADYRENNKQEYIDMQMKYVIGENEEDVESARKAYIDGMEADEVIMQYSANYDEENGVQTIAINQLDLDADVTERILALEVSDASEVIEDTSGAYVFFIVDEKNIPDDSELEADYRESYIDEKTYELFNDQLEEWKGAAVIEVNQRAFNSVK